MFLLWKWSPAKTNNVMLVISQDINVIIIIIIKQTHDSSDGQALLPY